MVTVDVYPGEPGDGGWTNLTAYDAFVRWAVALNASDIKFVSAQCVYIAVYGNWWQVTRRRVSAHEIKELLNRLTNRSDASARIEGGKAVNFRYELMKIEGDRRGGGIALRGNATACANGSTKGATITLRVISDVVPTMDGVNLKHDLRDHLFPHHGVVSISGVMGSGKTSTIASVMRHIRETSRRSVATIEEPIEYDLSKVSGMGPLEQMEVPAMIESFKEGIVAATRKAVNVLLVGETNNRETMKALVQAGEIGIAVYHTLHTESVSTIPSRIIHEFPHEDKSSIAASYLSSARLLVQQRLVPRKGGGRLVVLREWLSIDNAMRSKLIDMPVERLQSALERMLHEHGVPLLVAAQNAYTEDLISDDVFNEIRREKK